MFINTVMLAGIAGAALPLVVHLLGRARLKTVDWGAMMFLAQEHRTQEQAARLKQWTLLLLRMATVALLAIAMARPIATGSWAGPAGPLNAVIVLDGSASMAQPTDSGRTRADAAREAVLWILSRLEKGDRATLIVAGAATRISNAAPTADLQSVAARAAELKPGAGAADMAAALNDAAAVLERHGGANGHLYLVCDTQAASWQGINEPFQSAWRQRTTRNGRPLPFDVVIVGEDQPADNTAVQSMTLVSPPAIAGLAAEVEVTVRHFGIRPRSPLPIVVRSAKGELFTGTMELATGGASTLTVPVRFDAPGQQTLTAEITSGTLGFDDRLQHVIDVVPPVRVLIVSGDDRGGSAAFRSESDFLRTALAPFAALKRSGAVDPARVVVLPIDKWTDGRIDDADVLVLANIAELTPQQVRSVESFVYAGGGLLVAPGAASRPQSYNRALFRDAAGLLPASLDAPFSEQPTSLLGIELSHPIFRFLRGRPDPIPSAVIARFFAATPRAGAAILASYVTGQPFLVEGRYGRGRVLLMTTTIDADWNTLPLSSFYLPFVQSAAGYLAASALPQRSLAAGQELWVRFADAPEDARVSLTQPGGRRTVLQASGYEGNYEWTTTDTDTPGVYTVRATVGGQERVERFVVRHPLSESDLRPLDEPQWAALQRSLAFRRISPTARAILPISVVGRTGRELWLPVLLGVFGLVAVELVLTRFWSEGR
ncbi:MAG TPA: BatA domain-containing protein [Tepidisphaeraceae bacterium]|nr:BatA domain-containing protein [Tepidisphaeraceae bacterium]